jgi:hypothetical protein
VSEKETGSANLYDKAADAEQYGEIAHERHEVIRSALEQEEHKHKEKQSEREILAKAKELAEETDKQREETDKLAPARRRSGPISKKQRESSFKSQMKYAQNEMKPTERVFSRFIHNKAVEKTSDAVGSTVARPNAMLSGSIAAFIGVTGLYFIAKYYGFQLSGFETIACFVIGWIVGILYDYFSVMIRGHKKE